jgi:SAM-dependent methyltransferase
VQPEAYRLMAELEADHWWYRGRRRLLELLIDRLLPPPAPGGPAATEPRLLEVGAGTGANLEVLARRGRAHGVEPSPECLPLLRERGQCRVLRARAGELPYRDGSFALVAALDVLEHLHDDLAALDEMRRVLAPGGHLVLLVPSYAALWGPEDVISKHLRRYRAGEIGRLIDAASLTRVHLGYYLATLLAPVALVKIGKRLLQSPDAPPRSDVGRLPPAPLNGLLTALAESEAEVAAQAELPFGTSVLAVARRD